MNQTNDKYSWDPIKRAENIEKRGLDIVELADGIFVDPDLAVKLDTRKDYSEQRYLAFALVNDSRLCLCFTPRGDKIHLITIFNLKEKIWRKYHGGEN